jgi:hypothetical protein
MMSDTDVSGTEVYCGTENAFAEHGDKGAFIPPDCFDTAILAMSTGETPTLDRQA